MSNGTMLRSVKFFIVILLFLGVLSISLDRKDKYFDEPTYSQYLLKQSTEWEQLAEPFLIQPDDATSSIKNEKLQNLWKESDVKVLNDFNKRHKLSQSHHEYFYKKAQVPIIYLIEDLTGDGKKEDVVISVDIGCASCHTEYIHIFTQGIVFSTDFNKGSFYPRKDNKGFYLDEFYTGKEYATCCPDNIKLYRFQWTGKEFKSDKVKSISI